MARERREERGEKGERSGEGRGERGEGERERERERGEGRGEGNEKWEGVRRGNRSVGWKGKYRRREGEGAAHTRFLQKIRTKGTNCCHYYDIN